MRDMRFRKKLVVIEAMQFDGTRESGCLIRERWYQVTFGLTDGKHGIEWNGLLEIPTLEGVMAAKAGDWIIQGIKGELYPCKPDIFKATYEEIGE
jgi:hypothetical protein